MSEFQFTLSDLNLTEDSLNDPSIKQMLEEFLGSESLTSKTIEVFLITIYTLMSVATIVTNSAVLVVIVKTKKLCVPTHLLLLNLMIADILLATVCMPFTLISLIRRSWPFGWLFCKIIPLIQGTVVFASSITIAVIAADRWSRVTSTVPVNNNCNLATFSRKKLLLQVLLIWVVSLAFASPMAVYQVETEVGFPGIISYPKCIERWPHHSFGFYSLAVLFIQLITPMTLLIISFIKIRSHLRQNLAKLLPSGCPPNRKILMAMRRGNSDESNETTFGEILQDESPVSRPCDESQKKRILREMERNRKVTNTLLSVSGSFIFCWMPWNAINILMDFHPNLIPSNVAYALLATGHIIAMSSAIANPLLYGYTNTNIRKELRFRSSSPDSSS